jgi:4-amino-4-deoxy-L-arabinose transferase-like glycosyltransferase
MTLWPAGRGRAIALVLLLALAWLGATAGLRPLLLPDEGRYVGVAWEMLRSGDWAVPTLAGMPFFHKPPLFYWLTAAALQLFGPHDWAARAASLLGAALAGAALYAFLRRWADERLARHSLVALLVQPLFYVGAQFANLDMLVAGCITATTLLAAHALLCTANGLPARGALAAACAMAAAGVLAKGLIGVVVPALVVLAWLAATRQLRLLRALPWWPGPLLFAVLALPWFVLMQLRFPDFLHYFVVVQHLQRFAGGGFNNAQPFWFYPVVLAALSLPGLPWLLRGARAGRHVPDGPAPACGRTGAGPSVRLLLLVWAGVVVLFFSLPASKLLGYVLPAVPPLAALMADGYLRGGPPARRRRRNWAASLLLAAALGLAAIGTLVLRPQPSTRLLASTLGQLHQPGEPVFMLGNYHYDLPFHARLETAATVVGDWPVDRSTLPDNWRKELADAAGFAGAQGAHHLLSPAGLAAALCAAPRSWVVGPADAVSTHPVLQTAAVVAVQNGLRLWRVQPAAPATLNLLPCAETPNVAPADT